MSLSEDERRTAERILGSVFFSGQNSADNNNQPTVPSTPSEFEQSNGYITDIYLLPGMTEKLASLETEKFALLYGKLDGGIARVRALPFPWNAGPSLQDLQLAIQAANDVLYTRGRHELKLVGLYVPSLQVEQLEPYLDVGLGIQVVMGGQVKVGLEGEVYFEPRAISRSPIGEHFLVNAIRPIQ